MLAVKTILCIDDQQQVPFTSSKAFESVGYMFLRVNDDAMAHKVGELFKIDFVVYRGKLSDLEIMALVNATRDQQRLLLSEAV